jgi:acetolactate synthase I/II/III large subunit
LLEPVEVAKYAEPFGSMGFMVQATGQIGSTLKNAFEISVPVLSGNRVDYRDHHKFFEKAREYFPSRATQDLSRRLQ